MQIDLNIKDIQEKFIRSRGKGGQNVNKVATCVQLKHLPTGVTVRCEVYRTQKKNRELAMLLLLQKLSKLEEDRINLDRSNFEKEKRKHRRKPRALREKILRDKKLLGEKKQLRKRLI
jgi:peptide chain release factor